MITLQVEPRKKWRFPATLQSPLTDSNRRPPPYHGSSWATGGNPRQRFSPVSAISDVARFATDCHRLQPQGSIKAPSSVVCDGYTGGTHRRTRAAAVFGCRSRWPLCRRRLKEAGSPEPMGRGRTTQEPRRKAPAPQNRSMSERVMNAPARYACQNRHAGGAARPERRLVIAETFR